MSFFGRVPRFLKLPIGVSRRLERWSRPLLSLASDYGAVAKDILQGGRTRPIRSVVTITTAILCAAAWRKNPDMNGFVNEVIEYSNEISQCSQLIRNPKAQYCIENHILSLSHQSLTYANLGLVTIIFRRSNYKECFNYSHSCTHLLPGWWSIGDRLVDVGFWGRWWLLERDMVDFDVNSDDD